MAMKTVQITIDEKLLKQVDKVTRSRRTTRSAFVRVALEAELRRSFIREQEAQHAAGYANKPSVPGEFNAWEDEQDWGAA
jgi:metal-responsive CopG/Arc/MetJ family transcriptional regulator